jgi:glycosyltransferase involved in cell wall biosynthesis
VSREKTPKQLIRLLGERSFLQEAVERVLPLVPMKNIFVITNELQAAEVRKQLPKLPRENVVAEPIGRDTCAAVTLGAALVGARSMYFCVGGPWEVLDGGIHAENRAFALLGFPDPTIEEQLVRAAGLSDLIIAMGTRAASFFRSRGTKSEIHVVSGGVDVAALRGANGSPDLDVVLTARLVPIKAIDLFLQALASVREAIPGVKAAVVGDGPLRETLEAQARDLGLDDAVAFPGFDRNVVGWLRRARVFVLTSESEGLALALMEAMAAGLPVVVPAVGDLGDLVQEGVNGLLRGGIVAGKHGAVEAAVESGTLRKRTDVEWLQELDDIAIVSRNGFVDGNGNHHGAANSLKL